MYPYSPSSASGEKGTNNPAANHAEPSMSNTSRVDVFASHGSGNGNNENDKYAEFWEHVVPLAMHETLEPGDVLLFPPGWWHAMRSEETSFSVSMWY
jgi:ectoine hydroxylase-related dioxygenase (phytanoyl-CoA dioxygenase family)